MANINEFKYKLVKNFLSKEELSILKKYCWNRLDEDWTTNIQSPFSPAWYKDALMDSMLELKLSRMEEETGLKLYPTFSFWRYYQFGGILENHRDRLACEIAVTVCIHQTEVWPIHMENNWIEMDEGDAVVYLGAELEHGRKPFKGDGCAQVFMFYVDQNNKFAHLKHDIGSDRDKNIFLTKNGNK